jgi:alanyl aminopeptidase
MGAMRRAAAVAAVCVSIGAIRAADAPLGRLGHDVVPVSQSIALELDPRQPDYTGSVDVVLDVKKPVRSFRFHAEALDLLELTLTQAGSASKPIRLKAVAKDDAQVEVTAEQGIPKGRHTLHIDFKNNFDTRANGLYRLQVQGAWYAFTQFEAIEAREAFPCWDEPAFKIPYQVTLTVPVADSAISNTLEESVIEHDGKRTTVFKTTRPLPSYLLAVATGPLEFVPIPGTSVPARVVTTKGQSALAGEAVAMTPPILSALERYFGSKHPYEKLDLIAVPEYWYGAMENPGAITFVDRLLLHDPATVDDDARERLAVTTAHEIAHMWFGDLVTMAWWDDLWLNESFASWMEDKITAEVFPEFDAPIDELKAAQRVMALDSLLSTRAMRQPVVSMDSLLQSADDLAYSKGAAVLHMVEAWIGPAAFRSGVQAYLKAHADGSATADDLWSALGKAAKQDVRAVLVSFLDQPGVPLVTVVPLPGGRAKLTQTRFLNAGAVAPRAASWKIPVTLRYPLSSGSVTQRVLLTQAEQIVALETKTTPAWIHPNADEAGYYRWSVPPAVFARLTADSPGMLDTRERVGFVGNASALLKAGQLRGDDYVRVLEGFASDPEPEVVDSVVSGLETIRETFFAEGREAALAPFVRGILAPALQRFGSVRRNGETAAVTALRPQLLDALGDAGRDDAVLSEMERLASAYVADAASVDPSLAEVAVQLSAIRGDAALFDRYRARFEAAKVPAERRLFLSSLGNFRDPALSDRALDYVFAGPLRPQEILTIPRTMGSVPEKQNKTFTWMTAHYDQIAARIPADFMVFMPYFADGCSTSRADAAKTFFDDPKHSPPGTSTELKRVAEEVGDCVDLDAREGESVRRYITEQKWGRQGTGDLTPSVQPPPAP